MPELKPSEFLCKLCGGVFKKARSDEEALAEMKQNYGDLKPEERAIVCGECHKLVEMFTRPISLH